MAHTSISISRDDPQTTTPTVIENFPIPSPSTSPPAPVTKSRRGFASMSPEAQKKIASMGGKSVPSDRRSFSQNRALASVAGRKGGQSIRPDQRSFFQNRKLAAEAGRKGGKNVPDEKRSFSTNTELAREAGRKGGLS